MHLFTLNKMSSHWFDIDMNGLQEKLAKTVNEASKLVDEASLLNLDNIYDENLEKLEKKKSLANQEKRSMTTAAHVETEIKSSDNKSEVIYHYENGSDNAKDTMKEIPNVVISQDSMGPQRFPLDKPKLKPKSNASVGLFADDYYVSDAEEENVGERITGNGNKVSMSVETTPLKSPILDVSDSQPIPGMLYPQNNHVDNSTKPSKGGLGDIIITGASSLSTIGGNAKSSNGAGVDSLLHCDKETGLEEVEDVEGDMDPILLLIQRNKERLMNNFQNGINSAYQTPTKATCSHPALCDEAPGTDSKSSGSGDQGTPIKIFSYFSTLGDSIADKFKRAPGLPTALPLTAAPPAAHSTPSSSNQKSSVTICSLLISILKGAAGLVYNVLLWILYNIQGFPPASTNSDPTSSNAGTLSSIFSSFFTIVGQVVTLLYTILASIRYCINGNGDPNVTLLNKLADPNIISMYASLMKHVVTLLVLIS